MGPSSWQLALAAARGRASARRFWKVARKGFPILQRLPEQTPAERSSYSSDFLYTLTTDRPRMEAFRDAIAQFRAGRVLEIGCGPWTPLVELCLQNGASKVLALEASKDHAEAARLRLQSQGNAEVAEVLHGRAADLPTEDLLASLGGE